MASTEQSHPERKNAAFEHFIRRIGAVEMDFGELFLRKRALSTMLDIGMNRVKRGEAPTQADGGVLAIPTGLPLTLPSEAWGQVSPGTTAVTGEFGGTNWKIYQAKKSEDGFLQLGEPAKIYNHLQEREVTFDGFVGKMADGLADEYFKMKRSEGRDVPFVGAISLGFPHINVQNEGSPDIDAYLLLHDNGKGPKEWQITDYDADRPQSLAHAMREQLRARGVSNIERLVFINDTSAVLLDNESAEEAKQQGYTHFPNGSVGGSGTNININGINTEIAHALWPSDPLYERMYANNWIQTEKPELEHETGQYLGYRIAAAVEMLAEQGINFDPEPGHIERPSNEIVSSILWNIENNQHYYLLDRIARGEEYAEPLLKQLVQRMMVRAGQAYGLMYASAAEAALGERTGESTPVAMLTEGNAIHKGVGIIATAEETARGLGQPIKIIKAQRGAYGVTRLAMAQPYLQDEV